MTTLIELLEASLEASRVGDSERTIALLGRIDSEHASMRGVFAPFMQSSSLENPLRRGQLIAQLERELKSQRALLPERDALSESLGMSISDFFAEAPLESEVIDDVELPPGEVGTFDLESPPNESEVDIHSDHFSFADLGGELSFENLDFSFESSGLEGDEPIDLLEDIWPEDDGSILDALSEAELEDHQPFVHLEQEAPRAPHTPPVQAEDSAKAGLPSSALPLPPPIAPSSSPPRALDEISIEEGASEEEIIDLLFDDSSPPPSPDAPAYDGFFDELDEQAQWFSTSSPGEETPGQEQSASEPFELVEIASEDRFDIRPPAGISGMSETHDEQSAFGVFHLEEQAVEVESLEEESAARPDDLGALLSEIDSESEAEQEILVPLSHHEPEPAPELTFSFDFDESEEPVELEGARSESPEPLDVEPDEEPAPSLEPAAQSIPQTHQQDERAPELDFGFGELSLESEPAPTLPPSPVSLRPPPPIFLDEEPATRAVDMPTRVIDMPTQQVDVEDIGSLLISEAKPHSPARRADPVVDPQANRQTASLPAVDPSLVNPFDQDDQGAFGAANDHNWAFDEGPAAMPGLQDDWLDQAPSQEEPAHMRDVHNDATAIPGMSASNSGISYNPYPRAGDTSRQPSSPPVSMRAGISSPGGNTSGPALRPAAERSAPPVLRQTRENQRVYQDQGAEDPISRTQEHDYEQLARELKDTAERASNESQAPQREEEDEFDDLFDLGLSAPRVDEVKPSGDELDLFADAPQGAVKSTMFGAPFVAPKKAPSPLDDMPTPLPSPKQEVVPEDMSEDEFFALAESIAAENSVASIDKGFSESDLGRPYRGEPMIHGEPSRGRLSTLPLQSVEGAQPPPNPFDAQPVTGLRMPVVSAAQSSSFALEEVEDDELDVDVDQSSHEEETFLRAQLAYERGDFEEALEVALALRGGARDAEVRVLIAAIEEEIESLQLERIGPLSRIPVIDVQPDLLSTLDLDHRAGFLLSQIDGFLTFEDLLDLSAMPRLETILVIADLLDRSVIKIM